MKKKLIIAGITLFFVIGMFIPIAGSQSLFSRAARSVRTLTASFNNLLSSSDMDVQKALDTLDDDQGGTPFYDTLGEAVRKALEFDADASDGTRLEYVIGMTDGESNTD